MFENRMPGSGESPENKEQIERVRIEFGEFEIPKEGHATSEDSIFTDKEDMLFAVFDGLGGHSAGEVASKIASRRLKENRNKIETANRKRSADPQQVAEQLSSKLIGIDAEIYAESQKDPSKQKMGTTASVAKIFENPDGKRFVVVANAGDSRVYLFSDGKLKKITKDDNNLKSLGVREEDIERIEDKLDNAKSVDDLDDLGVAAFRMRNMVSNYLGKKNGAVIRTTILELSDGDKIVITSDGIHDNLATEEIEKIIGEDLPPKSVSTNLVRAARDRSEELDSETGERHLRAKKDDMSTVVIEIEPKPRGIPIEDEITQKIIRK